MGTYNKVSDEKIDLIFRLMPLHNNQKEVARAVKLTSTTVSRILKARMIEQNKKAEDEKSELFNVDSYLKSIITI